MTVSEYEARFQELSRYATMILPTEEEMIQCFVRGLRTQLRDETHSLVTAGPEIIKAGPNSSSSRVSLANLYNPHSRL
ncbi:hypothetical protein MTR67_030835 [Solanum verrucosum]|uniref:Retrotransposon gag domain-containing protein n=1 Tax=Solanum verrucosum TaxID=315347 RepID=A0AAF0U1C1_SOLVR|nr:hypothetical protein MTR67_030835 [Solanum verrucosum]